MKLKINNLVKSFDDVVVLNNVNLDIEDVHALAIIGPSGGGKTTLLRILAGLEKPDSGEVIVNGRPLVFEEKLLHDYRKTVGMVFQSYNLFPHMSALENITLPLEKVHHFEKTKAKTISEQLLDKFELLEHKEKLPSQLSGGQRQRVAIARALSINPQFLLLDEPTSALDPSLTKGVIRTINTLKEDKKDLILVTHEMAFAKEACDYCLFVSGGTIADQGTSEVIFDQKNSRQLQQFLDE